MLANRLGHLPGQCPGGYATLNGIICLLYIQGIRYSPLVPVIMYVHTLTARGWLEGSVTRSWFHLRNMYSVHRSDTPHCLYLIYWGLTYTIKEVVIVWTNLDTTMAIPGYGVNPPTFVVTGTQPHNPGLLTSPNQLSVLFMLIFITAPHLDKNRTCHVHVISKQGEEVYTLVTYISSRYHRTGFN